MAMANWSLNIKTTSSQLHLSKKAMNFFFKETGTEKLAFRKTNTGLKLSSV